MNEEVTSVIEEITPEKAMIWLDKSKTENRSLSQAVITSYAESMKKGDWLLNGEAITFDSNGNLLNGHHRLRAVISSCCSIKSFVVRGVNKKAFSTFDCGRHRTFGQLISMQGASNGNNIAAIVKQYVVFKKGMNFNRQGSYDLKTVLHETNKTLVEMYIKNKSFFDELALKVISICGKRRVLRHSFVGASIAYLIRDLGYYEDFVYDFFTQICDVDTAKNETINLVRKRLFNERNDRKKSVLVLDHEALTIKCFNAVVNEKKAKCFSWDKEKEGFPQYLNFKETKKYSQLKEI